jgi:uncharacterized MAPEG superfamily protein
MNIANVMVLVAALLPYATVGAAKATKGYDNANPRSWMAGLEGFPARAAAAHANHFEAFAPFAAAVILAEMAHAPQDQINLFAEIFIAIRLLYTVIYLANIAALRSVVWMAGIACVIRIFAFAL